MISELMFSSQEHVYEDDEYTVWDTDYSAVLCIRASGLFIEFSYADWQGLRMDVLDPLEEEKEYNPRLSSVSAIWHNEDFTGKPVTGLCLLKRGCLLSIDDWDSFSLMLLKVGDVAPWKTLAEADLPTDSRVDLVNIICNLL